MCHKHGPFLIAKEGRVRGMSPQSKERSRMLSRPPPLEKLFAVDVQSLSCVWLFVSDGLWPARQSSLSIISQSSLRFTSVDSVMPSNHLILCHSPLLLPSVFPSIRAFSNEAVLCIRWPKWEGPGLPKREQGREGWVSVVAGFHSRSVCASHFPSLVWSVDCRHSVPVSPRIFCLVWDLIFYFFPIEWSPSLRSLMGGGLSIPVSDSED